MLYTFIKEIILIDEYFYRYNFNFDIYVGSDIYSEYCDIGLCTRIVLTLTFPLHTLGYHVYMDRYVEM